MVRGKIIDLGIKMGINEEAFERLRTALNVKSRSYRRSEIIQHPLGNREQTVAVGLDRTAATQFAIDERVAIGGRLSVRALMAVEGVVNPFEIIDGRSKKRAAQWLIRSRFQFTVSNSRLSLPEGLHIAEAVYVLAAGDPKKIDEHFAGGDSDEDVEILSAWYRHEPTDILRQDVAIRRADLIRCWIQDPLLASGMSMISPTENGGIDASELPQTIDWVLAGADQQA